MELIIDVSTLKPSTTNLITGDIYFDIDGYIFIDEVWSDFVLILISSWLYELKSKPTKAKLYFMEGSYYVEITQPLTGLAKFRCVKDEWPNNKLTIMKEGEFCLSGLILSMKRCLNLIYNSYIGDNRDDVREYINMTLENNR